MAKQMSTRHLIDPEIVPILELIPNTSLGNENLAEIRAVMAGDELQHDPSCPPRIQQIPASNNAPDIPVYIYNVDRTKTGRPLILHIHGGGMVVGSARVSLQSLPPVLREFDAVGISIDYRLAPETPFPGPQEDCYDALRWAIANAQTLGIDPDRIIVAGESAGGGLAAALSIMVRDRGEFQIAGQALIYPMLDHRTGGPDTIWQNPFAGEFIWTPQNNVFGWQCLRGKYEVNDSRAAHFSPALLEDYTGLPPTVLLTGGLDLFIDENLEFARRLTSAGVWTELHLYPRVIHGFNVIAEAAISKEAARDYVNGIRRILSSVAN